ncbi:hypothetical protein QVD17_13045 [Tagetes erecta]|uniref:Uncharacterized protein n=1 Tax=Tagetes erecta TaxID=13708 RepID=A0AAD8P374_TARER|nr:hypothetical protein QVD17_13045 [Tagetes erecta]
MFTAIPSFALLYSMDEEEEGCVRIHSLHQVKQALHIGVKFYTINGLSFLSLGYVHGKQKVCPHKAVLSSFPRSPSNCWRAIEAQLDLFTNYDGSPKPVLPAPFYAHS